MRINEIEFSAEEAVVMALQPAGFAMTTRDNALLRFDVASAVLVAPKYKELGLDRLADELTEPQGDT